MPKKINVKPGEISPDDRTPLTTLPDKATPVNELKFGNKVASVKKYIAEGKTREFIVAKGFSKGTVSRQMLYFKAEHPEEYEKMYGHLKTNKPAVKKEPVVTIEKVVVEESNDIPETRKTDIIIDKNVEIGLTQTPVITSYPLAHTEKVEKMLRTKKPKKEVKPKIISNAPITDDIPQGQRISNIERERYETPALLSFPLSDNTPINILEDLIDSARTLIIANGLDSTQAIQDKYKLLATAFNERTGRENHYSSDWLTPKEKTKLQTDIENQEPLW